MMEKITKINSITLDEKGEEFCLGHDHGIKTFNLENFKEENNSNNIEFILGNISLAHYFPENEDLIVFIGSKDNKDYPPYNLVFFDITEKTIILNKKFDREISNFKCVSNFVIIAFGSSLIIYSYDKNKNELEQKEEHNIEKNSLFECWIEKQQDIINNLYLAYPKEKELIIVHYKIYEWEYGNKLNIQSPVSSIQNLFYVKKINQIFISDEQAKYIYGFDIDDGKKKLCLYRGKRPGFITSVALLNDGKYLAVNNLDRTIHIFDLDINNNSFSFSNLLYGIISDIEEIYPKMRIYYEKILENMEGLFFQSNFAKKGSVLFSDNDDELIIIAYNGFAFKIKINFKELSYKVVLKEEYVEKKLKNMSLYTSGLEGSDK